MRITAAKNSGALENSGEWENRSVGLLLTVRDSAESITFWKVRMECRLDGKGKFKDLTRKDDEWGARTHPGRRGG